MQRCPQCDHIHLIEAAVCERCGTPLPPAEAEPSTDASGPPPGSFEAEILALAASKGKIEAIKRYRQARNSSLKDAKDEVERLIDQYRPAGSAPGGRSGCGAVVLLGMSAIGLCGWLLAIA